MNTITVQSIIETAIRAEELGISFYSELAKKVAKNEELKAILELLAKDEVEHKRQFTNLLKEVEQQSFELSDADKDYMQGVDVSKFFDSMETIDPNANPQTVLAKAYAFEKESVLFYIGLRDIIGSNTQLDQIIKYEKSHMTKLMKYVFEDSKFRGIVDQW